MSTLNFALSATVRDTVGKGASRRLRRLTNNIPGILYGGKNKAVALSIRANELNKQMQHEAFYSHIIDLNLSGKIEQVVLKDMQCHPFKPVVLHVDLQRVSKTEKIHMRVPLHFINEDKAPGVKTQGGIISHNMNDIDITCLPQNLPEYIEVDLINLAKDQTMHLSDLKLPKGVEIISQVDATHNLPVVSIHAPKNNAVDTEINDATEEASSE